MIGLCLVDGINDQYKITKYPLLSKMSEKNVVWIPLHLDLMYYQSLGLMVLVPKHWMA